MDSLLLNDFLAFHNYLNHGYIVEFVDTNSVNFELIDNVPLVCFSAGCGVAVYENPNALNIRVISFDLFINQVHRHFLSQSICDLFVYTTETNAYFSLAELTDTKPNYVNDFINSTGSKVGKRNKAISQLLSSLNLLIAVPAISAFMGSYAKRRCCFFNKQSASPSPISATTSFNRVNVLLPNGFSRPYPAFNNLGFQFWEFSGGMHETIT